MFRDNRSPLAVGQERGGAYICEHNRQLSVCAVCAPKADALMAKQDVEMVERLQKPPKTVLCSSCNTCVPTNTPHVCNS